jgi:hypothetical protein
LTPDTLGTLTLADLYDMVEGYNLREQKELEKLALLASWIMSPHLKKPITPDKLLKPAQTESQKNEKSTNPDETRRLLADLEEELR